MFERSNRIDRERAARDIETCELPDLDRVVFAHVRTSLTNCDFTRVQPRWTPYVGVGQAPSGWIMHASTISYCFFAQSSKDDENVSGTGVHNDCCDTGNHSHPTLSIALRWNSICTVFSYR